MYICICQVPRIYLSMGLAIIQALYRSHFMFPTLDFASRTLVIRTSWSRDFRPTGASLRTIPRRGLNKGSVAVSTRLGVHSLGVPITRALLVGAYLGGPSIFGNSPSVGRSD